MIDPKLPARLTVKALEQLKSKGYRYVLIKGVGYIESDNLQLVPVKELPVDPAQQEVYAPLDSEILLEWAKAEYPITFVSFLPYKLQ